MLSVIAQPDARDMTAWNSPAPDFGAGLEQGVRGLRIALSLRLGQSSNSIRDIEAALRKVARVLEEQGAIVEEADPPLARAADTDPRDVVAGDGGAGRCGRAGAPRRNGCRACWTLPSAAGASRPATIIAAYNARTELHNAMLAFHARYDLLLTPTMPITALKVGLVVPDDGGFGDDWLNWSPYTYPFNLTQQPAASRAVRARRATACRWARRSSGRCGRTRWCCGRRGRSSGRCRCRSRPA